MKIAIAVLWTISGLLWVASGNAAMAFLVGNLAGAFWARAAIRERA